MTLVKLICLYGYSYTVFLAVLPLCAINIWWIQWFIIILGFLFNGNFLMKVLSKEFEQLSDKTSFIIFGAAGAVQFIYLMVIKL